SNHAIVQQFLVACRRFPVAKLVVVKLQFHRPSTDSRPRGFSAHLEGDALLWLDVKYQVVWRDRIGFVRRKQRHRGTPFQVLERIAQLARRQIADKHAHVETNPESVTTPAFTDTAR